MTVNPVLMSPWVRTILTGMFYACGFPVCELLPESFKIFEAIPWYAGTATGWTFTPEIVRGRRMLIERFKIVKYACRIPRLGNNYALCELDNPETYRCAGGSAIIVTSTFGSEHGEDTLRKAGFLTMPPINSMEQVTFYRTFESMRALKSWARHCPKLFPRIDRTDWHAWANY